MKAEKRNFKKTDKEPEIFYTETQQFRQWWVWMILVGQNALFFWGICKQLILRQPFGEFPMSNPVLIFITCLSLLLTFLFLVLRLDMCIKSDGIYVRFFPFHRSYRFYPWNSLTKVYIRQYSPVAEYGGWGVRSGLSGKGKAYNVYGDKVLQIEFTDRKKLLIGTNKPYKMEEVLDMMGQLK